MYQGRRPFERQQDGTGLAFKIGLAIFLALTLSWGVRTLYLQWMMQEIGNAFVHSAEEIQVRNQENLRRLQVEQAARMAEMETRRALAEQQKAQADLERTRLLQAQNEALETARQEESIKAKTWEKYFRPRAECVNPQTVQFVECGNDYIRAKRRFEEDWPKIKAKELMAIDR